MYVSYRFWCWDEISKARHGLCSHFYSLSPSTRTFWSGHFCWVIIHWIIHPILHWDTLRCGDSTDISMLQSRRKTDVLYSTVQPYSLSGAEAHDVPIRWPTIHLNVDGLSCCCFLFFDERSPIRQPNLLSLQLFRTKPSHVIAVSLKLAHQSHSVV